MKPAYFLAKKLATEKRAKLFGKDPTSEKFKLTKPKTIGKKLQR
jgi:hypothetical protein